MTSKWTKRSLAELCDLFTDGDWVETKDQSPSGVRLIQTGNVGEGRFKDRKAKARFISSETFARRKCEEVLPGDCLVSRLPDPVGRACIIPETGETMITAVDCTIMRFKEPLISPQFFIYYSQSKHYLDEVESLCTGATRKRISRKNLGKVTIDVPPTWEQQRIVAILDEAFAGIDAAIANTEKNLANARELFEGFLANFFNQSCQSYPQKTLSDICTFSSGGTPSKKNNAYWNGNIPWVSGRDMKSTQLFDSQLHISESAVTESSTRLAPKGSLLVLVRGMGLAHGAQIAELMVAGAFNQDIKAIHPKPEIVPQYLLYALRHKINSSENILSNAAHGTLKINSEGLSNVLLAVPPKERQQEIVASIEALKFEARQLETIYHRKLIALGELKQSLLQKAFTGELTAESIENEAREVVV